MGHRAIADGPSGCVWIHAVRGQPWSLSDKLLCERYPDENFELLEVLVSPGHSWDPRDSMPLLYLFR
jgi:hypothetical protein